MTFSSNLSQRRLHQLVCGTSANFLSLFFLFLSVIQLFLRCCGWVGGAGVATHRLNDGNK